MRLHKKIKKIVQRTTGLYILEELPHGVEISHDIAQRLPHHRVEVVFDVGANIGQSAKRYSKYFPGAIIYSFEPVPAVFARMQERVRRFDRIRCFNVGLGASAGKVAMAVDERSTMSQMVGADATGERVLVDVTTLDEFCAVQAVERIDILKIDTEGLDLDVLRGARQLLAEQRIGIVEVEAGMHGGNTRHVPFEVLKAYLEASGYSLFGIYEQISEWPTGEPHLRRTNPAFVSQRLIERNRGAGDPTLTGGDRLTTAAG
jgi:FkbM family methyltransferase